MKTHKHITNKLERRITAAALCGFRKIDKPKNITARYYVYASSIDGVVLDECTICTETWKLIKIQYLLNRGGKQIQVAINYP